MSFPKQPNESPDYYVVKNPTSNTAGPRETIARANNETYRANNGCYPARPYGAGGYTYSTGK